VSLAAAREDHADQWIAWARTSSYGPFWEGTWPTLRDLLPEPGSGPVIDVGCGEGRVGRELVKLGYRVVGFDCSPTLAAAASSARPAVAVLLAEAAAMPFATAAG
jgi:SAM-dependent methyltransferase